MKIAFVVVYVIFHRSIIQHKHQNNTCAIDLFIIWNMVIIFNVRSKYASYNISAIKWVETFYLNGNTLPVLLQSIVYHTTNNGILFEIQILGNEKYFSSFWM